MFPPYRIHHLGVIVMLVSTICTEIAINRTNKQIKKLREKMEQNDE